MLSLLSKVTQSAYNYVFGKTEDRTDINEVIKELNDATSEVKQVQASLEKDDIEDDEGCFYANGTVTTITENYVILNNKLYCEKHNICPTELQLGQKVKYLGYQLDEDKEVKVSKILSKVDEWLEAVEDDDELEQDSDTESAEQRVASKVEKQKMMTKIINLTVTNREKRLVYAGDLSMDLDKVASEFVPLIGDVLKITALVAVDADSPNLTGDVVNIRKIEPFRSKLITGLVTNFDTRLKTGNVDRNIIFHRGAVSVGYVPYVGDTVICDCIQSEQGNFSWRAISVIPVNKINSKQISKELNSKGIELPPNMSDLEKDKHGVKIGRDLKVDLQVNEDREINVNIENTGFMSLLLHSCSFLTDSNKSQLRLIRPEMNSKLILNSNELVTYVFKCRAKYIGKSIEVVQFNFKNFQIARTVEINVRAKKTQHTAPSNVQFNRDIVYTRTMEDQDVRIPGIRPFKAAPFAVSTGVYRITDEFWKVVLDIKNSKLSQREAEVQLAVAMPSLSNNLTFATYRKHFRDLLFLEEIAQHNALQMYNMESVILKRAGEYLSMEVPGLAEKRPSLIINDKVVVRFKWDSNNAKKMYEGFIHKIKSSDIFIKFNAQFHESYNGQDCSVAFEGSNTVIQRCHRAIHAVAANLKEPFLFPSQVIQKDPQYLLEEIEESEKTKQDISEFSTARCFQEPHELMDMPYETDAINYYKKILKTRKLRWFNKSLNKYQKEAVKNILMGVARPLPYVIFGPPGTGKTVTLCEAIMQIYSLIPDSVIIVATPSNSSANLITERLIDEKILKPGDMVRLTARYYMASDAIPEKLLPYCATADLTSVNASSRNQGYTEDKHSYNSTILGRHRITIGTCATLGILHNLGFKPGHFTHVLVDEAGQATEPEIMIPLSYITAQSGQVILAGDPLQLGPVVLSKYASYFGFSESFLARVLQRFPYQRDLEGFEHGYDPRLVTKLLINYRSLPEILELPNNLFYDAELIPQISSKTSKEAQILQKLKDELPYRGNSPPAVVFHGVNGVNRQDSDSPSWFNSEEATQVYLYFLRLTEKGLTADDIGIITPYKKQVTEIRGLLCDLGVDIPKVGTVEEFQGQERNVIILSTVRSVSSLVAEDVKFTLGFVSAPQRLNVAITRAQSLLIIIGNPFLLSRDSHWRSVLDYCKTRSSYTGCNLECSSSWVEPEETTTASDQFF